MTPVRMRGRGPLLAFVGVALLALSAASSAVAPPALARGATEAEVARLAADAVSGDRRALTRLREIDRVDGHGVQLAEDLGGRGAHLRSRLRALAEGNARRDTPDRDAGATREAARGLLADERYSEPTFPRPLRGVFEWIGTTAAPLLAAGGEAIDSVASLLPGGRSVGLAILAGLTVLGFAALASRTLRLRSRSRATEATRKRDRALGPSPAELERAAVDAERAGDLSLAVRLRFRAGLVTLERRGTISLRASHTTAAIGLRLDSREFAAVAGAFEEVAYGGRTAEPADVEAQRAGWRRVLAEVGA